MSDISRPPSPPAPTTPESVERGRRLGVWRSMRDITIGEMARALGLSAAELSAVEHGRAMLVVERIQPS